MNLISAGLPRRCAPRNDGKGAAPRHDGKRQALLTMYVKLLIQNSRYTVNSVFFCTNLDAFTLWHTACENR